MYRLIYYSKSALHVLGDVFAHHQEHLTVFSVSGSVHPSCCPLVSWMSWNCGMWDVRRAMYASHPTYRSFNSSKTPADSNSGEHYQILKIQASAPDDGRKHRLKHVELTWNNKLTYAFASCWLLSKLYHDARIHEHQIISWCTDPWTSNYIMMHGSMNIKHTLFFLKTLKEKATYRTVVDNADDIKMNFKLIGW